MIGRTGLLSAKGEAQCFLTIRRSKIFPNIETKQLNLRVPFRPLLFCHSGGICPLYEEASAAKRVQRGRISVK
jgi:hypothetical protein